METKKILVTGGAGFIGSHIVDELIAQGHAVRILDNFDPQVHAGGKGHIHPQAEFIQGDVRDEEVIKKAMEDIEVVFHKAAAVGVGQSMYQIAHYVDVNNMGTARLLDFIVNKKNAVQKIIVASSMSSYGEGAYECSCGRQRPALRTEEQMAAGKWDLICKTCGETMKPLPVNEGDEFIPSSIYALTKMDQEKMVHITGKAYGIPSVALRYFNVYGPRQSLNNPYTGVAAIFMSRIKNDNSPMVFEDGLQTRDFVDVKDITQANVLSMKQNSANYDTFNVGSGKVISILKIAEILADIFGKDITPQITKQFRKGDIRHCFADISKIKSKLGYEPKINFEDGMKELVEWARTVESVDKVNQAEQELRDKGLLHG